MKNACAKTVKRDEAYEVWQSPDASWTWYVLKKWQANDDKPYARWFCDVVTPMCPNGEMGDVYVAEIKRNAVRIDKPKASDCFHGIINITGWDAEGDIIGVCFFCGEAVSS